MRAVARGASELFVWWSPAPMGAYLRISDLSGRADAQALDGCGWRQVPIAPANGSTLVSGLTGGRLYWVELLGPDGARLDAAPPVETPRREATPASPLPRLHQLPEELYGRS